ncbi:MAG: hypothetical protein E6Z13_00515 [Dermabacter sp.]|nr:hypothetical protein [Dermabacter sp.]
MGSDGGGDLIQWVDTAVNAGATFLAAVLAAAVAVWLARLERKSAEKQRQDAVRHEAEVRRAVRKQELTWDLQLQVLNMLDQVVQSIQRLQHAALLDDPSRLDFRYSELLLCVGSLMLQFNEEAADKINEIADAFPDEGTPERRKRILEWAPVAINELSAMRTAFTLTWYAKEADLRLHPRCYDEPQATSASDESSAEESDAKSSS